MDTLDALGFDRLSKTDIFTPVKITQDMVNLLPEEVFNPETKFLDIACKSGRFLVTLKDRLMESTTMMEIFPDKKDRLNHILNNQLFGLATSEMCLLISTRNLYGSISELRNIRYINNYEDKVKRHKINIEYLEKEFNRDMKIDIVVGNPPYNNDTYLDFVQFGHSLASQYTVMITPAKWQAKGGEKNEQFRKNIVPYMSKIVYYPCCYDVFTGVNSDYPKIHSGVSYFVIDKNEHTKKQIKEICSVNRLLNYYWEYNDKYIYTLYDNRVIGIINKVKNCSKNSFIPSKRGIAGKINVGICSMFSWGGFLNIYGQTFALIEPYIWIDKDTLSNSMVLKTCNTTEEALSIISYINTKLIRFLAFISCTSQNINNETTWRFVPAPSNFDHIFTDEELYKKYNLTEKEIEIVESVIKERK